MIGHGLKVAIASAALLLSGCATGGAIQPDRSVFNLDGNYQRFEYQLPIEQTFDRTVAVFKEAGYRFDVIDRATGQISGERTFDKNSTYKGGKGQKIYALIIPAASDESQIALKIVQIIQSGSLMGKSNTEIIASDSKMYQYIFRRIESFSQDSPSETKNPNELPPRIPY